MKSSLILAEKLLSSAVPNLTNQLQAIEGAHIHLDGREVRAIGARAAELLLRFKQNTEAAGGTLTIEASSELAQDLQILAMKEALLEEGTKS